MSQLIIKENNLAVNNNILRIVEYKGEKVVSSYDIARIHNKEVKRVNEQFERNKDRLQEGVDYFLIKRREISKSQLATLPFCAVKPHPSGRGYQARLHSSSKNVKIQLIVFHWLLKSC